MNAHIDFQTILAPDGKPEFVVLRYAQCVKTYGQAKLLLPNEVVNLTFGRNCNPARAWREHLNLTRSALAKRLGVSQAAVAQFEATGAKLRKASRERMAAALGLLGKQLAWRDLLSTCP